MLKLWKFSALLGLGMILTCGRASAQSQINYPDRKALVVNNCPYVELSDFSFGNREDSPVDRFYQMLSWQNVGKQPLIAIDVVVLKYDAFNLRMMGSRWTVTGKDSADWRPLQPDSTGRDSTLSYGPEEVFTAIAYVRCVRLKNGKVWKTNDKELLLKLKATAPDIDDFGTLNPDPKPKEVR